MPGTRPGMTMESLGGSKEKLHLQAIHSARIVGEDLLPVALAQERHGVDVSLGVVVVISGFRIDAAHRADDLRGKQDVVDRNGLEQKLDARPMVHTGVEVDILEELR